MKNSFLFSSAYNVLHQHNQLAQKLQIINDYVEKKCYLCSLKN